MYMEFCTLMKMEGTHSSVNYSHKNIIEKHTQKNSMKFKNSQKKMCYLGNQSYIVNLKSKTRRLTPQMLFMEEIYDRIEACEFLYC